jgi:WXG100 family type VII secretion target
MNSGGSAVQSPVRGHRFGDSSRDATDDSIGNMTMPNLRVTPDTLRAGAADCDKRGAEILEQLEALRSYVASFPDIWGGQTANDFAALMHSWQGLASQLKDALEGTARGIRYDADHYSTAERSANTKVTSLADALPNAASGPALPQSRF